MKLGIALGRVNPAFFVETTLEAERLGYESVWMPEHLVFTLDMSGSPHLDDGDVALPATSPVQDVFAYLGHLAALTTRIRLGTNVYNVGLRHPFTVARGVTTVDRLSNGRLEFGIGASWLRQEWEAAQLDFATRGARVDEALAICQRLWTESVIEHHGEHFDFQPVAFEPKPAQAPHPPILVGGESGAALRRAARIGDGWIGMGHTPESVVDRVTRLQQLREEHGTADRPFTVTVESQTVDKADIEAWEDAGVDRLIVSPWARSKDALEGMRALAADVLSS
ncbi:MAG: luciferase [Actinomycetia bacterium]|nr:luciferase [Actinomycetes bacterium]